MTKNHRPGIHHHRASHRIRAHEAKSINRMKADPIDIASEVHPETAINMREGYVFQSDSKFIFHI